MTDLVDGGEQGFPEIGPVVSRRDAGIIRMAAGKGMRTLVDAAANEIQAKHFHHFFRQCSLPLDRKRPVARLPGDGNFNHRRNAAPDLPEQSIRSFPGQTRFPLLEQAVVGSASERGPRGVRHFPGQIQHNLELADNRVPVVGPAGVQPCRLA